jgi:hypothetical protein
MKLALELGHDGLIVPSSLISWRGDFVAESTDRVRSAIFARRFGMIVERGQGDQKRRDQPTEAGQLCNRLEIFLAPDRPPRVGREQHRRARDPPTAR